MRLLEPKLTFAEVNQVAELSLFDDTEGKQQSSQSIAIPKACAYPRAAGFMAHTVASWFGYRAASQLLTYPLKHWQVSIRYAYGDAAAPTPSQPNRPLTIQIASYLRQFHNVRSTQQFGLEVGVGESHLLGFPQNRVHRPIKKALLNGLPPFQGIVPEHGLSLLLRPRFTSPPIILTRLEFCSWGESPTLMSLGEKWSPFNPRANVDIGLTQHTIYSNGRDAVAGSNHTCSITSPVSLNDGLNVYVSVHQTSLADSYSHVNGVLKQPAPGRPGVLEFEIGVPYYGQGTIR